MSDAHEQAGARSGVDGRGAAVAPGASPVRVDVADAGGSAASGPRGFSLWEGDWQSRLGQVIETMKELSRHTDPQAMVRSYSARMKALRLSDRMVSLSRRGLASPNYRVTRSSTWTEEVNPWRDTAKLPLHGGGLFAELLYGDEPRVIDDVKVADDDPAAPYVAGMKSLVAIPHYDQGVGLNMVISMRGEASGFEREKLPELVWMSNLFGRATNSLLMTTRLKEAYEEIERELKTVADIQRSLLPPRVPLMKNLDLATYYQTSRNAGGDYFDFFPLSGDRLGMLIADVSGHGTPAAVHMAVTHALAHQFQGEPNEPGRLLTHLNRELAQRYMGTSGMFVTAFYGVFDPRSLTMTYSSAGHNPPRVRTGYGTDVLNMDRAQGLPLGVLDDTGYTEAKVSLAPGDVMILYTDGITETFAPPPSTGMFGVERLDGVLAQCRPEAQGILDAVLSAVEEYGGGRPATDDRTMIVGKVG